MSSRIQFTIGPDIVLNPRQAGDPPNFFIYPYVEVDGKPFQNIAKTFGYQDHSGSTAAGAGATRRRSSEPYGSGPDQQ